MKAHLRWRPRWSIVSQLFPFYLQYHQDEKREEDHFTSCSLYRFPHNGCSFRCMTLVQGSSVQSIISRYHTSSRSNLFIINNVYYSGPQQPLLFTFNIKGYQSAHSRPRDLYGHCHCHSERIRSCAGKHVSFNLII